MDNIKFAFNKVKEDINSLKEGLDNLRVAFGKISERVDEIYGFLKKDPELKKETNFSITPAHDDRNKIDTANIPAHNSDFRQLKGQNLAISIGSDGVPTDRQTDRQTDKYTKDSFINQKNRKHAIKTASDILDSLDSIKKEIRLMFKGITEQEMLIFSTIYQMEELGYCDYRSLADKLSLTESSIRDYVGKLIKKGIPVDKIKVNNKKINLKVSEDLKRIATLPVILKLREV